MKEIVEFTIKVMTICTIIAMVITGGSTVMANGICLLVLQNILGTFMVGCLICGLVLTLIAATDEFMRLIMNRKK